MKIVVVITVLSVLFFSATQNKTKKGNQAAEGNCALRS
jgi:hypothetical protein